MTAGLPGRASGRRTGSSTRRSAIRGCHEGSAEVDEGRTEGARSEAVSGTDSSMRWTDSATGIGAGVFLGRPRRRFGATSSTAGVNRDEIGGLGVGCETEAGSRECSRRLATGDADDGRVGARSTRRSTSTLTSPAIVVGASAGSRGGVSGRKGGSAATGTGSTSGLVMMGASLVAGSGLPQDTSPA